MEDRFTLMLNMQLELQKQHMKDGDPRFIAGDEMADFMRWNAFALTDEIHEAMQEVGWKPWAKTRHLAIEPFFGEMVDAFHFFMNMLLCAAGPGVTPQEIADRFTKAYLEKNAENIRRQVEGYDGKKEKCPKCGRELVNRNPITGELTSKPLCRECDPL